MISVRYKNSPIKLEVAARTEAALLMKHAK
jgi:hypothetical protein